MVGERRNTREEREKLSLGQAANYLLNECRMVLPGIQALFGFQLIAVFSPGFGEKLSNVEQRLHLLAIGLSMIAIAIIMTPAALHRQTDAQQITARFIRISTLLLLWSMFPLALSICLDFYLVAQAILDERLAALLAVIFFGVFAVLWFVLPHTHIVRKSAAD